MLYKHTNVSGKHLREQTQFKLIVKKELVATNGLLISDVSVFGAKTRKVAQQPSTFSTRNTLERGPVASKSSLLIGILQGTPLPQQVKSVTGLVLQFKVLTEHPKKPRSQVSKQESLQFHLYKRIHYYLDCYCT